MLKNDLHQYLQRMNYAFYDCCKNQQHFFLSWIAQATGLITIFNNFIIAILFELFIEERFFMKSSYFQSIKLIYFRIHSILKNLSFSFLLLNLILHHLIQIQKITRDCCNHLIAHRQKYYGLDHYLK